MKPTIAIPLLCLVTGCGASFKPVIQKPPAPAQGHRAPFVAASTPTVKAKVPKAIQASPTVAFVGDQLMYSAVQPLLADNPTWINDASDSWETSASMLTRFQAVLDQKPNVVVIWAGEGDLVNYPDWSGDDQCGAYTDTQGNLGETCYNWGAMAKLAQAAGVKCIIADLSEYAYQPDPNADIEIFGYDEQLYLIYNQDGGSYGSQLLEFETLLAGDQYFVNDGSEVSAAGSAVIENAVKAMVAQLIPQGK